MSEKVAVSSRTLFFMLLKCQQDTRSNPTMTHISLEAWVFMPVVDLASGTQAPHVDITLFLKLGNDIGNLKLFSLTFL